ncbi:DUF7344 domain-containing protein [Natrialba asiatica]|uniref:DUF7344 domain-containing protein n=1 Tax=Natrialba asiatica (strain ATCC 700177 / DSM 12278 / JCM 9576 / FERM P-10747 / NBRC 102637 / 172P1) TaxID=29540 RepID=M0ALJ3_NATA1|nr:hypothetical protein [Natrialba asiatica]ELY98792.1 hypothetical protein C481_16632 [Natrialba asiatica DSM 12278]
MTATSHSAVDCAEFILAALDWLEARDDLTDPTAIDDAFDLLANQRRRLFLEVMTTYEDDLTLPDVAEEVAVRETDTAVAELSADRVAETYISLYHDHLPRLVDAGLIEYDQERDLVHPTAIRKP